MGFPEIYLSAPAVILPQTQLSNADVLARVRAHYQGAESDWAAIERRINGIFRLCGSQIRYREELNPFPMADHALGAARRCLAAQGVSAGDLNRVIYGGISREYFEPATAAEIAGRLGAHGAVPFDVIGACAGALLGLHTFAAHAALEPDVQLGMVCTLGVTVGHLSWAIQSPEQALSLAAGLTVGNAATAFLLSRQPLPCSGRVLLSRVEGFSQYHGLCKAPLNQPFTSESVEIFRISRPLTVAHVKKTLDMVGWAAEEVDHIVSHQPSNRVLQEISSEVGLPLDRTCRIHHLYGNTESSAVPLSLRHVLDTGGIRPGAKVLMVAAAGGILLASAAVVWEQ